MLTLSDIWAGYGSTTVLRGVSLEIPNGAVVALLGPNGAGKTTLLRVAAGLLPPARGQVLLDGRDITGDRAEDRVRAGLSLVPEGRGVYPSLTVRENLCLQAPRGQEEAGIAAAVEAFPVLGQRLSQVAGTMSGGEQQMLGLSRAYVRRPRLVLVDEVSMGLAPVIVDQIYDFLGRLVAEGTSLLVVEQFVDKALSLAGTAHILHKGQLRFSGPTADLAHAEVFAEYLGVA